MMDCTLCIDGEAVFALDRETGERRPGTTKDWLDATRLIDALDEHDDVDAVYSNSDIPDDVVDALSKE